MGFWKRLFFPKKEYRSAAKAWIENPEKVQKSINRVLDTFFDSTLKELMPEKISLSLEPVAGLRIPEDKVKPFCKGSTSERFFLSTQYPKQ